MDQHLLLDLEFWKCSKKLPVPVFRPPNCCQFKFLDPPEVDRNAKKGPLSHQKMKCSFMDYIQLLMIGWAIWATKIDKNAPPKCLRMAWNGQFHLICNFSNLFPPKWLRITWNSQFHPIHNFSNLFPLKWLRMTQNGIFCVAKKKTIWQENFYERLHFYMDSCAISPTASLFTYFFFRSAGNVIPTNKKDLT